MQKISKSDYARLVKENKELLQDIKVFACGEPFEAIQMRLKWRERFKLIEITL